ncbi:MAG: carbonic anhydrase, partial [Ilumatobacteraceae bacterium]
EIILVHHTNCGLQTVTDEAFKAELEAEVGIKPWWALESFADPFADVLQSINRLRHSPFVRHKDHIRGFVYDVADGRLHEVTVG